MKRTVSMELDEDNQQHPAIQATSPETNRKKTLKVKSPDPKTKVKSEELHAFHQRRKAYALAYRHIANQSIKSWESSSTHVHIPGTVPRAIVQVRHFMNRIRELYEPQVGMAVHCAGTNNAEQLGYSDDLVDAEGSSLFIPVHSLPTNVVSVQAGGFHSLALTDEGTVYSWGDNSEGQCGRCLFNPQNDMAMEFDIFSRAYPIDLPERIIAFGAGATHSLVMSLEGNIYYFGSYRDSRGGTFFRDQAEDPNDPRFEEERMIAKCRMETFLEGEKDASTATGVNPDVFEYMPPPTGIQYFPIKIAVPEQVVKIACGATSNAAILKSGRCVTWGLNHSGELGRITGSMDLTPTDVSWKDEKELAKSNLQRKVLNVACGGSHILVVAQDGSSDNWCVYAAGSNNFGQLGLGFRITKKSMMMSGIEEIHVLTRVRIYFIFIGEWDTCA